MADLALDPCWPVGQWKVLVTGRPLGLTLVQDERLERTASLPWPTSRAGPEQSVVVYERGTSAVFLRVEADPAGSDRVRAVLPKGWVGGTSAELGHRGLYKIDPPTAPDDAPMLLMGPWEGSMSSYRGPETETIGLRTGGWHVSAAIVMGPARDAPSRLEHRFLLLYRVGPRSEDLELVWSRATRPLPRARDPHAEMVMNEGLEPKDDRYRVIDLRDVPPK